MKRTLAALLFLVCFPAYSATYYVRSAGGNDGNAGTSFAQGWATIQKAADTAVGGDVVLVCADGTHLPTAVVDFDTNAGSLAAPITFRGAGATGTDDGTDATISGTSLGAGADLIFFNVAGLSILFSDLRFTAGKDDNFTTGTSTYYAAFIRCRIDSAADAGFYSTSSNIGTLSFLDSEIDTNGGNGLSHNTVFRGVYRLIKSRVHDNIGRGIMAGGQLGSSYYAQNLIYDNGSDGLYLDGATSADVIANTIRGNGGDGIDTNSGVGFQQIQNNTIAENGAYGINTHGLGYQLVVDYNHFHSNTSGEMDVATMGSNNQTGDPLFTSVVDGSENFVPLSGSPLIDNGLLGQTIGAYGAPHSSGFFHPFNSVVLGQ